MPTALVVPRGFDTLGSNGSRPSALRRLHSPASTILPATPARARPEVLLVFLSLFEESSSMLKGVADYLRTHRQWAAFLDDQAKSERDPDWILSKKWDGVISRHTTPAMAKRCAEMGIPLIDVNDTPVLPGVPKVRPDNVAVGHLAAEHFLERSFDYYAYCGYHDEPWSCERREGFREALRLAGRTCEIYDVEHPGLLTPFNDEEQVADLAAWLARLPKPVGVLAANDLRALQVLNAARSGGLGVPDEVALLGVNDDSVRCEFAYPSLSSIRLNSFQNGYLAAEMLDTLMQGGRLNRRMSGSSRSMSLPGSRQTVWRLAIGRWRPPCPTSGSTPVLASK